MSAVMKFWGNAVPCSQGGAKRADQGVYTGEALPPVPMKLAKRIQDWEFIDMAELLPEFWAKPEDGDAGKQTGIPRKKRVVTDLKVWLQCYAVYVGVLSAKHPEVVPELMAYMVAIIRACEDYAGMAWLRYDAAYRRQAAANGNREWSRINPSLYSLCFTGKSMTAKRCDLCLSTAHTSRECPLASEADPDLPMRLKAVESAVVAFASSNSGSDRRASNPNSRPGESVCRVWNEKRCFFRRCRFRHVCIECAGPHPVLDCPNAGKQGGGPVRQPGGPWRQQPYQPQPQWKQF